MPYYHGYGEEQIEVFAKTAGAAVEKLKNELCKITEREEARHAKNLERKAGIKTTTFSREQDCCSVKPRPKLFDEHT